MSRFRVDNGHTPPVHPGHTRLRARHHHRVAPSGPRQVASASQAFSFAGSRLDVVENDGAGRTPGDSTPTRYALAGNGASVLSGAAARATVRMTVKTGRGASITSPASARRRPDAGAQGRDLPVEPGESRLLCVVRGADLGNTGQARHTLRRAKLGHEVSPLALELDEAELVRAVIPAQGERLGDLVDEHVVRGDRPGGEGQDENEGEELAHARILARQKRDVDLLEPGRRWPRREAGPTPACRGWAPRARCRLCRSARMRRPWAAPRCARRGATAGTLATA